MCVVKSVGGNMLKILVITVTAVGTFIGVWIWFTGGTQGSNSQEGSMPQKALILTLFSSTIFLGTYVIYLGSGVSQTDLEIDIVRYCFQEERTKQEVVDRFSLVPEGKIINTLADLVQRRKLREIWRRNDEVKREYLYYQSDGLD